MMIGELVRCAVLGTIPSSIPGIPPAHLAALEGAADRLNQFTRAMNGAAIAGKTSPAPVPMDMILADASRGLALVTELTDLIESTSRSIGHHRTAGNVPSLAPVRERRCVSVRLNDSELAVVDLNRKALCLSRGEYLHRAAFRALDSITPQHNLRAYQILAGVKNNLTQFPLALRRRMRDFEVGRLSDLQRLEEAAAATQVQVTRLRQALVGAGEVGGGA